MAAIGIIGRDGRMGQAIAAAIEGGEHTLAGAVDKGEDRFFTNWDVVGKKFTLSLQFADEDLRKTTPAPGSGGGKHRADLRYDMKY